MTALQLHIKTFENFQCGQGSQHLHGANGNDFFWGNFARSGQGNG